MNLIISPKARSDISAVLAWTRENFGALTMERYERLIKIAVEAIAANPEVAESEPRPEIARNCRTYHLFHSRKKAGTRGERIREPRHFLLYRVTEAGVVEIGRVLHDSMEIARHLPREYGDPTD
jgi:toxin ParE1/3/4